MQRVKGHRVVWPCAVAREEPVPHHGVEWKEVAIVAIRRLPRGHYSGQQIDRRVRVRLDRRVARRVDQKGRRAQPVALIVSIVAAEAHLARERSARGLCRVARREAVRLLFLRREVDGRFEVAFDGRRRRRVVRLEGEAEARGRRDACALAGGKGPVRRRLDVVARAEEAELVREGGGVLRVLQVRMPQRALRAARGEVCCRREVARPRGEVDRHQHIAIALDLVAPLAGQRDRAHRQRVGRERHEVRVAARRQQQHDDVGRPHKMASATPRSASKLGITETRPISSVALRAPRRARQRRGPRCAFFSVTELARRPHQPRESSQSHLTCRRQWRR